MSSWRGARATVVDDERCEWSDLSSQFYASEEDVVGKGVGRREPRCAWGNCRN